jgi:hypothetical protein
MSMAQLAKEMSFVNDGITSLGLLSDGCFVLGVQV